MRPCAEVAATAGVAAVETAAGGAAWGRSASVTSRQGLIADTSSLSIGKGRLSGQDGGGGECVWAHYAQPIRGAAPGHGGGCSNFLQAHHEQTVRGRRVRPGGGCGACVQTGTLCSTSQDVCQARTEDASRVYRYTTLTWTGRRARPYRADDELGEKYDEFADGGDADRTQYQNQKHEEYYKVRPSLIGYAHHVTGCHVTQARHVEHRYTLCSTHYRVPHHSQTRRISVHITLATLQNPTSLNTRRIPALIMLTTSLGGTSLNKRGCRTWMTS